ncbi:hypothetical protein CVT24_002615 [Panaeolus cyanescens]|uniref:Probable cytosolic iron-sulfur protein assembly protein 1 n=1 Tax=Panaeolus cyanescens TaxID=181874 RepID=A0A409YTW7_9AGAR|nr:hypothetical protein CVT24_002615 [Panaeolus cyanescens]
MSTKIVQIADLSGHQDRAWQVAWNPSKPLIASCSADKSVRMWSYTPRYTSSSAPLNFVAHPEIPTGHAKSVRTIAWSPSGTQLATGSFDANIGVWEKEPDSDQWECTSTLEGHETECKSVAFSPTGPLLASCSRDKTVWIWEVLPDGEFETISVLMEHTQDVKAVAWHPLDEVLASASYDDTVKLYIEDPTDDWFCFATLEGHTSTVWALAWSPPFGSDPYSAGTYLASASDDQTIRIWQRVAKHKFECVLVITGEEPSTPGGKQVEKRFQRSLYSISWRAKPEGWGTQSTISDSMQVDGESENVVKEANWTSLGWLACTGGDGAVWIFELELPPLPSAATNKPLPPRATLIASVEQAHDIHDVNSVAWCPTSLKPAEGSESSPPLPPMFATAGDDGHIRVWELL